MTALRKPDAVAADLYSVDLPSSPRKAATLAVATRDAEIQPILWDVLAMLPRAHAVPRTMLDNLRLSLGGIGLPPWPEDPPPAVDAEEMAHAQHEIARLSEALAAAERERDDNAADRDRFRKAYEETAEIRDSLADELTRPSPAVSPLVALASDIAKGPMGQGLVAWLPAETNAAMRVDADRTADNVLAVARRILGGAS